MSEQLPDVPNPIVMDAGTGEEISLLQPHLKVQIKAEMAVLLSTPVEPSEEGEITGNEITLGSKSGRGRIMYFKNFDSLVDYANERAGKEPKLEVHSEEEIYEPADNRSPEELVEAGELPSEILQFQAAMDEGGE
jgi:hypothetical protein